MKPCILPCHAGCVGSTIDANSATIYTDCACGAPSGNRQATEGDCDKEPTWQDECDTQLTIMLDPGLNTPMFTQKWKHTQVYTVELSF